MDANADTYQTYYEEARNLPEYPLLATAKPYIIGFPGKTYYEFDLSGEFVARNTAATAPARLDKQAVSFVSEPGITIAVSDDELSAVPLDNYSFMPNYTSKTVTGYLMNAKGSSFSKTPAGGLAAVPFRPYFVAATNHARQHTRSILFGSNDSSFAFSEEQDPSDDSAGQGDLAFTVSRHMLSVTSSLRRETDVRIVNMSGLTIATFTIQPGETVHTNITVGGVYIVRADGGRIQKKLAIR